MTPFLWNNDPQTHKSSNSVSVHIELNKYKQNTEINVEDS